MDILLDHGEWGLPGRSGVHHAFVRRRPDRIVGTSYGVQRLRETLVRVDHTDNEIYGVTVVRSGIPNGGTIACFTLYAKRILLVREVLSRSRNLISRART